MPKMFVLVPYFCLCYIFFNFLLLFPFLVDFFFFHLLFERLYILVLLLRACHKRMRTFVFIIVIMLELLTNSLFSVSLQINLHLQISSFIREILGISSFAYLVAKWCMDCKSHTFRAFKSNVYERVLELIELRPRRAFNVFLVEITDLETLWPT